MSVLLLFQSLGGTPVTPSGAFSLPVSGIVQIEYPGGMEQTADASGYVGEEARMSGVLGDS